MGVSILYCWIKVSIVVCDFDIDICKRNIHGTENLQTEQDSGATQLASEPPTKEKSLVPPDLEVDWCLVEHAPGPSAA